MSTLYTKIKKIPFYISYPIIFLSALLLITNILGMLRVTSFDRIYSYINSNIELIFAPLVVSFLVCFALDSGKKGIAAGVSIAMADLVMYAVCSLHFSLVFSLAIGLISIWIFDRYDLFYAFFISLILGLVISVVIGVMYDYLFDLLKSLCTFISKQNFLLGATDNAYTIFISKNFSEIFYNKDYSGALLINGKIVSGIKDIFLADTKNRVSAVAWYMGGKYLVNMFLTLGLFFALYSRLNSNELGAFFMCSALAIVFGDVRLLSLFILVYNPFVYLAYLAVITLSYLCAGLLDIKIGYEKYGSIIELASYGERWIYLFLSGAVLAILTYFVTAFVLQRLDVRSNMLLPRNIKKTVKSLGGQRNIQRVASNCIYVKNPNIIDILSLDCEIYENQVFMRSDDIEALKEYF